MLIGIIAVLTVCFILSAVSGIEKGIQWLSNINMVLALALAFFVFVVGPTVFILNLVPTTIGSYFKDLAMMSARTDAAGGDGMKDWLAGWTIFYWAWWVSWTPFVGMFIARISRGRTIRQFVSGVLLVPSVVSLIWFAIFGGAGIDQQQNGQDIAGPVVARGLALRDARQPALADRDRGRRHAPRRDLLRVGRRRRVDRHGHAVGEGHARAVEEDRGLLGRGHGRRRRDHAAHRW